MPEPPPELPTNWGALGTEVLRRGGGGRKLCAAGEIFWAKSKKGMRIVPEGKRRRRTKRKRFLPEEKKKKKNPDKAQRGPILKGKSLWGSRTCRSSRGGEKKKKEEDARTKWISVRAQKAGEEGGRSYRGPSERKR